MISETDTKVVVIHFTSGDLVIGQLHAASVQIVVVKNPMTLALQYDDNDLVASFSFRPYMHPFVEITPSSTIVFNMMTIISCVPVNDDMRDAFINATARMFNDNAMSQTDSDDSQRNNESEPKRDKRILH